MLLVYTVELNNKEQIALKQRCSALYLYLKTIRHNTISIRSPVVVCGVFEIVFIFRNSMLISEYEDEMHVRSVMYVAPKAHFLISTEILITHVV